MISTNPTQTAPFDFLGDPTTILRLSVLAEQGFRFLATDDDGETWAGSHDYGLEIGELLRTNKFFGRVVVEKAA